MKRPLVLEDVLDDLRDYGPFYRSYCRARVAEFREAGLGGEVLQMAVDALEAARSQPGTVSHWRLAEAVKAHHLMSNQGD